MVRAFRPQLCISVVADDDGPLRDEAPLPAAAAARVTIDVALAAVGEVLQEAGALQPRAAQVVRDACLRRRSGPGAGDIPLGRRVLPDPGRLARPDGDVGL